MKSRAILLLTAFIWGFAFVAQRQGMESIPPFMFNGIRFLIGCVSLMPIAFVQQRRYSQTPAPSRATLWLGGIATGFVLFTAASLQQIGIVDTSAGKAGFITGLYVVIVPLMGLARGHRVGIWIWAGAIASVIGLYLLTVTDTLTIERGDLLVLGASFFLALHVQMIDRFSARIGAIRLSIIQFAVVVVCSFIVALAFETTTLDGLRAGLGAILYTGLLSVGVAYTLQVVGQRDTPPAQAAIILSLETVFAVIGGWLLLGENLPARGLLGCGLMFAGMLASQLGSNLSAERVGMFFNSTWWRQHVFSLVVGACVAFVGLSGLAMPFYAGGTARNQANPGYSFFTNFFSDLGRHVSYSGNANPISAVLFFCALMLAGAGLAIFFAAFPQFFIQTRSGKILSWSGSLLGIVAGVCFIGVALTPADINSTLHVQFVLWAFRLFPIAVGCYAVAIFRSRDYSKRYAWVFVLFAILLVLYILLLQYGPSTRTPEGLMIQATGQKIIAYASLISILIQAWGARQFAKSNVLLKEN